MLAYLPSDISTVAKDAATAHLQRFVKESLNKCADVQAVSYGWGVENDFPVRGGEEGQTGTILVTFIGWPSIDAQVKFQQTKAFKENMDSIRGIEGLAKLTQLHLSCQSLGKKIE